MEDAEVVEGGVNYAQGEDMFDQLMELAENLLEKDAVSVTDDQDLQILFKVHIYLTDLAPSTNFASCMPFTGHAIHVPIMCQR